jgi:cytochrome b561
MAPPPFSPLSIALLSLIPLSLYTAYAWYDSATWFTLHPLSFTIAFGVGMPLGIWLESGKRSQLGHYLHSTVNIVATVLACFGYYVIYSNKDAAGKPHAVSYHSWIGLVALTLLSVQVGLGLVKVSPTLTARDRRPWKDFHLKMALLVWLAGTATAFTGFYKTTYSTPALAYATVAVLFAAGTITRTRVRL